jgi:hypothetical protein
MTPRNLRITALALAALVFVTLTADARPRRDRGLRTWEVLGTMTVSDGADHDTMAVTAGKGTFRSLKLEVLDQAVQFHHMKIHFANGETQDVPLRNVIRAGGESRVVDIEGRGDRVIRTIELRYDAQSLLGKKARVRIYGKN